MRSVRTRAVWVLLALQACSTGSHAPPPGAPPDHDASSDGAGGSVSLDASPGDATVAASAGGTRTTRDASDRDVTRAPAIDASALDAALDAAREAAGDGATDADGGVLLDSAIARAIAYCVSVRNVAALEGVLWYLHRQFGIAEFSNAPALYDQYSANAGDRVYRRIVDHQTVADPADVAALTGVDVITYPALYCDTTAPSAGYAATLTTAEQAGGYELTHTLLALLWLRENSCNAGLAPSFEADVESRVALIPIATELPSDLEIESQAFLHSAARSDLVSPWFVARLLGAQHSDGGWSISGASTDASDWHPTSLALWVLLFARYSASPVPVLDPG
jgi:hypothetical protein